MQEVAAQAGVSVMTVSNVLTGKKLVTDATRAAVMQAVEALHYVPNIAARSLASESIQSPSGSASGSVDQTDTFDDMRGRI